MGSEWTRDKQASTNCQLPDFYAAIEYSINATSRESAERLRHIIDGQNENVPENDGPHKYSTQAKFRNEGQLLDIELYPGETISMLRPPKVSGKCISLCLFRTSPVGALRISLKAPLWVKSEWTETEI